jgi:molecular chaperone GrpE
MEAQREELLKYGAQESLAKLIEVLDNFERAQNAIANLDDAEKIKESFDLIQNQTIETLAKLGLKSIEAQGEIFDPNLHEAVMQTPTAEHAENTIINELQKGYKFEDKVLRPTLVNVATPS